MDSERPLAPFATGPVLAVATVAVVLLLAVAARYGYHRDELYFLAASRHLALGYVDQPPISVLVAWLDRVAFGSSLFWLRVIPALLVGLIVVMTAATAREFEASRFAQGFAALCAAGGAFLTVGHLEGPTVYDIAVLATTSWLIIRILRTGNERLWLAVGVVVGVGMEAKQTIPLLFVGLAVGIIMNRQAAIFRSRWLWGGVVIALVGVAPNIAWQISNHWPTATMNANLRAEHSGLGAALKYPFIMVLVFGLAVAPVLLAGWWALWQQSRLRPYRAFAFAFVIGFVLLWVVIPDRFYYLFGVYPVLLAAGAIVTEQVADGARGFFRARPRHRWLWRSRAWAVALVTFGAVVFLPAVLPVLPESAVASANLQSYNYNLGEEIGWPDLTREVAAVWNSLPPATRATTTIVTSNYGEAGALLRYGGRYGLPAAYSGHNAFWSWGPPRPDLGTTIAVGLDQSRLTPYFDNVRLAGTIHNGSDVKNDENGRPIWIATGPRAPWSKIWKHFKDYG